MKFTKLSKEFNRLIKKKRASKKIKPKDLAMLQKHLADKKANYTKKLKAKIDPDMRQLLKLKLKIVNAQIKKSKTLASK